MRTTVDKSDHVTNSVKEERDFHPNVFCFFCVALLCLDSFDYKHTVTSLWRTNRPRKTLRHCFVQNPGEQAECGRKRQRVRTVLGSGGAYQDRNWLFVVEAC